MTDICDIACDECSQWASGTVAGTARMRKILKEEGWTLRKGPRGLEDVCPDCNGKNKDYWFVRNR
jgi:hypothetical protein